MHYVRENLSSLLWRYNYVLGMLTEKLWLLRIGHVGKTE